MTATLDLFRNLSKTLDALVLRVDPELPLADDIHPALRAVGEYGADLLHLPANLSKLEAQKASAERSLPNRDVAIRKAKHAVVELEAKLKKLGKRIDHNRSVLTQEDEKPVAVQASDLIDGAVPQTRADLIEQIRLEMLATEDALAAARDKVKKAESGRKGVVTRVANLEKEIVAARKAIDDHHGRLEATIKILRKTINHLKNRQEKRDAKRKSCAPIQVTVVETAVEAPKPPTDEDIRKMAEAAGLSLDGPDDLEVARQLFLN